MSRVAPIVLFPLGFGAGFILSRLTLPRVRHPEHKRPEREVVAEASEESFPASDPLESTRVTDVGPPH